ncbi:hypothetical protein [Mycolicibacterium sarraceniae]|uniref:Uncharacterized protein n=1 Tax=Mycolicibacterium sarraceniae TaxID=1534348 RepID=A0A7I7SRS7_9MYCO|nr:hypothetical protein [Mycolicibacterium sarraceniae]BBY59071.1 hypothetical protein MSAR_22070 [Mycolicibacterium sarraceniae]
MSRTDEVFYSAEGLARRQERMAQARRAAAEAGGPELPDVTRLWYLEARTALSPTRTGLARMSS